MRVPAGAAVRRRTRGWTHALLAAALVLSCLLAPFRWASAALSPGLTGMQFTPAKLIEMRETVRGMFTHGYDSYLKYAFPHDELKPLSKSWTDSLSELGNSQRVHEKYKGVALTMIDSLSTLAVLGNKTEFARAVDWISSNIHFDLDVRVNLFEANIRILGGLLSAHVLALDPALQLHPTYNGALLPLAKDLGDRFLPAFKNVHPYEDEQNETDRSKKEKRTMELPYAWVNLKYGVEPGETAEQCTAGIGTLLLEFGLLSHLTNNSIYYDVAERSLFELWHQRNQHTNLIGNSLSCLTGDWSNPNSGTGAGIDSFFEYLLKSYIFFDNVKWLHAWEVAYAAVQRYLKYEQDWLVEADMNSGSHTHVQFNSLSAFWPGLQSLVGDFPTATATHAKHFGLWSRFDGVPERYLIQQHQIHSTEKHYILRPEVAESTYYLYRSTRHPMYLEMGMRMVESLEQYSRVEGGYASLRDLESKQLEDRMNSFFLAETVKYLYLLFDEANWVHSTGGQPSSVGGEDSLDGECHPSTCTHTKSGSPQSKGTQANWLFTTEGHIFPILSSVHAKFGDLSSNAGSFQADSSASSSTSWVHPGAYKSKYSLFTPLAKMNRDTRAYMKAWQKEAGATSRDSLQKLLRAQCPKIDSKYLPDPSQRVSSEFLRLARAFQFRQKVAHMCFAPTTETKSASGRGSLSPGSVFHQGDFSVLVSDGAFTITHGPSGERMEIRNLGQEKVEITNVLPLGGQEKSTAKAKHESQVLLRPVVLERTGKAYAYKLNSKISSAAYADVGEIPSVSPRVLSRFVHQCTREWDGIGAFFGPTPFPRRAQDGYGGERFSSYETQMFLLADVVMGEPMEGCAAPTNSTLYQGKIVLLQRGSCTFIDKIHLAQNLGAVAVVMMNNDDSPTAKNSLGADAGALRILMMGNDNSGREITIPSMMIPKRYADELSGCYHMHESIQVLAQSKNPQYVRQPFQLEMLKYVIPPTSLTSSTRQSSSSSSSLSSVSPSSSLHPRVVGDLMKFWVTSMHGWTVEIEEKNQSYLLKVY